jgi:hypothetical protein
MGDPVNGGTGYSWFLVELTSEHVEPPVEPEITSGQGRDFVSFGGPPEWEEVRVSIPTQVELPTVETTSLSTRAEVVLPVDVVELSLQAEVRLSSEFQAQFSCTRGPAVNWVRALQDEDELLLLL